MVPPRLRARRVNQAFRGTCKTSPRFSFAPWHFGRSVSLKGSQPWTPRRTGCIERSETGRRNGKVGKRAGKRWQALKSLIKNWKDDAFSSKFWGPKKYCLFSSKKCEFSGRVSWEWSHPAASPKISPKTMVLMATRSKKSL